MPRIAMVFPGQGAQYAGMGRELAQNFPEARYLFEQADDLTGYKISSLCFQGPQQKLDITEYAQPALLTASIAAYQVIRRQGILPSLLAGLSLGEYSALVAGGSLEFKEALPLVQMRARLMQNAVPPGRGAMAAVLNLSGQVVKDICAGIEGMVTIANYNCPGQVVISGEKQAVADACQLLQQAGGRTRLLAVSVPSHSPLMVAAAREFKKFLAPIEFRAPSPGVVSNVNARENEAGNIADLLVQQLYSSVLWEQSVYYMLEKVDYIIEVGPGSILSGLIKRINRGCVLGQVGDLKSLDKVLREVQALAE